MPCSRVSALAAVPLLALLAMLLLLTGPVQASQCHGDGPGATLLFPQIAVDLGSEEGESTLISISNLSNDAVLTNVVLWSNCSLPLLNFPLALDPQEVRSLNMRQILEEGRVPGSGPVDTSVYPSCPAEIEARMLTAEEQASLAARFAGTPDPGDGLCYAAETPESQPALGFLTVDVLNDCPTVAQNPYDDGYFVTGGVGVASNDNVLTGDFFFVTSSQDSAQGFAAVTLEADAERLAGDPSASFYNGLGDDRLPLSAYYRTRFLNGGAFDGGTDLLYWTQFADFFTGQPLVPPCDYCSGAGFFAANADLRTEDGLPAGGASWALKSSVGRVAVGSDILPSAADFGSLDFSVVINCGVCSPPFIGQAQNYVMPVYRAEGRYSAGIRPTPILDPCATLP